MLHSIAVTTDFSPVSRRAFGPVRTLAEKFGARLHVLHVAQGPQIYTPWQIVIEPPADQRRRIVELEKKLADLVRTERAFEGMRVEHQVLAGETPDAVRRFQEHADLDCIVVASHGHSNVESFTLGSFAGKLIHLASCPVLVIRCDSREIAVQGGSFHPKHILFPHDFSRASTAALEVARSWSRAFGSTVTLLYVAEELARPEDYLRGKTETVADYFENVRTEALKRLGHIAATDWEEGPIKVAVALGPPAAQILKEAENRNADLIIMASHGLSPIQRLTLGSVAERTIHRARCPVLVVRQNEKETLQIEGGGS